MRIITTNFCSRDYLERRPFSGRLLCLVAQNYLLSVQVFSPSEYVSRIAGRRADGLHQTLQQFDEELLDKGIYKDLYRKKDEHLKAARDGSLNLKEYARAVEKLDQHQGHDHWRASRRSIEPGYRPDVIEAHIEAMRNAIRLEDLDQLKNVLKTSLDRRLGGMDNIRLYKHSWFGTKNLIDVYNSTAVAAIETLVELMSRPGISEAEMISCRETLNKALVSHGRTALSFSGGALLGMKHIGVAKCLSDSNLLPDIISGTSAGSIIAAIVATKTPSELEKALLRFPDSNLAVFDAPASRAGIVAWCYRRLATYGRTGSWFDPAHLKHVLREEWLQDLTFQEAYNKTQRILNITISKASSAEPTILNYRTAPNVLIWSAVCASCAVPYKVFPAATVYMKDPDTKEVRTWIEHAHAQSHFTYVDGSLDHDIPARQLAELFDVSWTIVAQTNPHVRPFLTAEEEFTGVQPTTPNPHPGFLKIFKTTSHALAVHTAQALAAFRLPSPFWRWGALLTQQYTGDINIFPSFTLAEVLTMVANPSPDYMRRAPLDGERATWPKIFRIKNSVQIELALERAIRDSDVLIHFPDDVREDRARQLRQVSRSAHPPGFLRSKSLEANRRRRGSAGSLDLTGRRKQVDTRRLRRNQSLGSFILPEEAHRGPAAPTLPILQPQRGVNAFALMMTPIDSAASQQPGLSSQVEAVG